LCFWQFLHAQYLFIGRLAKKYIRPKFLPLRESNTVTDKIWSLNLGWEEKNGKNSGISGPAPEISTLDQGLQ
jgi:hypothetical protein